MLPKGCNNYSFFLSLSLSHSARRFITQKLSEGCSYHPFSLSERFFQQKFSEGCCLKSPTWGLHCVTCTEQHRGIYSHQLKDRELLKATLKHHYPCGNSYCKYSETCRFLKGSNYKLQEHILALRTSSLFLKCLFNYKHTTNYSK